MKKRIVMILAIAGVSALAAAPALAAVAPPGLHKAPAANNVPSHVCARCHS